MRHIAVVTLMVCALTVQAEEKTLVGSASVDNGGYGALVIKFSPINHKFGVLVGARGGWIINHTFAIGLAGYGLVNNVPADSPGPWGETLVNFGYGGLDLEYIANSDDLVHYSIHTLIGAGGVGFRNDAWSRMSWDFHESANPLRNTFFVLEPGVNIDLNVTPWFRLSAGASYRFVGGVTSEASSSEGLSGPSGMLTFRFGSF
jgi:hypothetical protein